MEENQGEYDARRAGLLTKRVSLSGADIFES